VATRGRRPKPTVLHKLEGTFNVTRHRARADEPTADGDLLAQPPDGLPANLVEGYSYAVTNAPRGVLRKIDRSVLIVWLEAEDRHWRAMQAQAELDSRSPKAPFLVQQRRRGGAQQGGELVVSPYLAIITVAAQTMLRAAAELGFSPASRPRLATNTLGVAVPNDSPWKRLKVLQGGGAA
jgi:phage terminase small subunit